MKKLIGVTLVAAIAVTTSFAAMLIWSAWPRYHLKLYDKALEDKSNLRRSSDGRYDNPYRVDFATYGAFGDLYGSLTSLFACLAFISTATALLIQIYLFYDQKNHQIETEKENRAFTFYDEFNSSEMFKVRIEADLYLRTNDDDFYKIAETSPYDLEDRGKGAGAIWPVMRFYQKLGKAIDYKQVNEAMVVDLFGEVFIWWYFAYFEYKLVSINHDKVWDTAEDLKKLKEWFERKCSQNKSEEKYQRWERAARDYWTKNQEKIKEKKEGVSPPDQEAV